MEPSHCLPAKATVLSDHDTAVLLLCITANQYLKYFIFTHQEKGGIFSGLIKKKETSAEVADHSVTVCTHFYNDFSIT